MDQQQNIPKVLSSLLTLGICVVLEKRCVVTAPLLPRDTSGDNLTQW